MSCERIIHWCGKVENIILSDDEHVFAYSGQIPCTGPLKCIYCGQYKDEIIKKED